MAMPMWMKELLRMFSRWPSSGGFSPSMLRVSPTAIWAIAAPVSATGPPSPMFSPAAVQWTAAAVSRAPSDGSPGHWWERGTSPMRVVHWAAETRLGRLATRVATGTRLARGWAVLPESPVEVVAAIAPRPLLIVHGDADRYFPIHHAEALAAAAAGSQLWSEAGMGHAESATTPALIARIDAWVRNTLDSTVPPGLRP